MSEAEEDERIGINWIQVVAGALAAVSSAVLLSTLGVAGTVIGAALGSVVASVASAWYSRGIDVSRQQVAVQAAALKRVTAARSQLDDAVSAVNRGEAGAETGLIRADQALEEAEEALEEATHPAVEEPGADDVGHAGTEAPAEDDEADDETTATADEPDTAETIRRLPWKHIALVAAAIFVAAMVTITVFELTTGRAVSTFTGGSDNGTGSTVPGVQNAPDDESGDQRPSDRPTGTPEEPSPTDGVTPTDAVTPTDGVTPTEAPTSEPTTSLPPTETTEPSPTTGSEPTPNDGSTG
jgi:hypothetical protein